MDGMASQLLGGELLGPVVAGGELLDARGVGVESNDVETGCESHCQGQPDVSEAYDANGGIFFGKVVERG
jgi:hypothetical protein